MKRKLKFAYTEENPALDISGYRAFLEQLKGRKGPYISHFEDWVEKRDELDFALAMASGGKHEYPRRVKEPFSAVTIGGHFTGIDGKHKDQYVRLTFTGQTLLFDEDGVADLYHITKTEGEELDFGRYDLIVASDSREAVIDAASLLLPGKGMREHIKRWTREN